MIAFAHCCFLRREEEAAGSIIYMISLFSDPFSIVDVHNL